MATVNHKKAIRAEQVTAFGGIDASASVGDGKIACDLKNFKVLADGSLKKRCGFATLASLPASIRAMRTVQDEGTLFLLAVAGRSLYRISVDGGEVLSSECLATESGEAVFFEHGGTLYLLDGAELYRYDGGVSLSSARGYIPLYGKNWNPYSSSNPIHEPINLFCDKIRIDYVESESENSANRFPTGVKIRSVDKMVRYGAEQSLGSFTISEDGTSVNFSLGQFLPLTLYVTVDRAYWHDAVLCSAKQVLTYEEPNRCFTVFTDCDKKGRVYASRQINSSLWATQTAFFSDLSSLYVAKDEWATFGNSRITAVERLGNRLLFTSPSQAWITEDLSEYPSFPFRMRMLSRTVGCTSSGGITVARGNRPITLSSGGIFEWRIAPDPANGFSLVRISTPIEPLLPPDFFTNARLLYLPTADELWAFLPHDPAGRVWIYHCDRKVWYSFVDVGASYVADTVLGVCFASDSDVCRFDQSLGIDLCAFGEREIEGVCVSPHMDFGNSETIKRALRVFVDADVGKGELSLHLSGKRLLDELLFRGKGPGVFTYSSAVRRNRFSRLTVALRACGRDPQRIFGFCVHASGGNNG